MTVHVFRRPDDWEARIDGDPERSRTGVLLQVAIRAAIEAHVPTALARDRITVELRTEDLRPRSA